MHEAKTKLSQLVERVQAGEDIIIARNGKPSHA
jgi:prevent-host-death family protein